MIYLKTSSGDLWTLKVTKSAQQISNKDGFSPATTTTTTTTTATKVSKLTTSQQHQQEEEQLYQYQQKQATVNTAEQEQMSLIMKMPTATAATASSPITAITNAPVVSPTPRAAKRNSPTSSNNSSPTKEKSERILHGGHYTAAAVQSREYRCTESGEDHNDWHTAVHSGTTTITPLQQHKTPIPKQRSAYSPVKNAASSTSSSSLAATRLAGTTGPSPTLREELQSTAGGDGSSAADKGTIHTATAVAVAGSGHGNGDGDVDEYMLGEKQENIQTNTTQHKTFTAESSGGGMYTAMGRQIPSTTAGSSPNRASANASVSAVSPLSPTLVAAQAFQSQQSQQFQTKHERERTYTEQRGASTSSSAGNNSKVNTPITKVQTQENNTVSGSGSSSRSSSSSGGGSPGSNNKLYNASPSNYAIPSLSSSNSAAGSGSGKIFTKLHNNQFIKNQQLQQTGAQSSSATQSNITARYLKYKSHSTHAQESAGGSETGSAGTNTSSSSNYTGLPGTYSPTKSFVAPTASAIKKKMVAVQEMKKTTQPSGNHGQLHPHRTHHNQQQMIGAGGGGGGTCARSPALTGGGGRANTNNQTEEVNFDPAEDLSYGPGIVSKLRCRYLSLAFRESMEKERHCLDNMRRATSLNNLLDREEPQDDDDEPDDDIDSGEANDVGIQEDEDYVELRADADRTSNSERKLKTQGGILKHSGDGTTQDNTKKTTTFQKHSNVFGANGTRLPNSAPAGTTGGAVSPANVATPDTPRSRHVKRGNDSLKRARSVEALLCERSPWQYAALNRTSYQPQRQNYAPTQPTCVTIEDKINNARSRLILGTDIMPPKRLTSVIDDTERPPPDLVKQTLKKFEATANRRGRGPNRANGTGEVANKVATYKTIIKENKPAIVFPKPPLSPTKKLNTPILTKPVAKPVVGATDLLNSPLGRKTTAAAAAQTNVNNAATGPGKPQATTVTTSTSNVAAVAAVLSSGLSESSPDIIPRHKLLTEKSESLMHGVVDSPVSALTKKLEKLRIDSADKLQTKETKQPTQLNKQQTINSALEATNNSDNEFVNIGELNNENNTSNSSKFVGGVDEGEAAGDNDAALEGNENSNNKITTKAVLATKQHNDRAGTSASISSSESVVEPDTAQQAGTAAISSDLSDDDDGLVDIAAAAPTKRITRTALDNIARAGTTQQFKFAASGQTNVGNNVNNKKLEQKTKPQTNINTDIPTSVFNAAPGKQIGVIRPLLTTTAAQQQGNTTNNSLSNQQQLLQQHLEALKQNNLYNNTTSTPIAAAGATTHSTIYHNTSPLTSREIEKNRINEMKKADGSPIVAATMVNTGSVNATSHAVAAAAANASLNTVINTNAPGHKGNGVGATTSSSTSTASPIVGTSGLNELDAAAQGANNSPLWALRIKRQAPPSVAQENTSMVFNFSNRKEVPDYIENDGVIFRRKRELPKPNESGFVLLGDLSLETSTDSDYDDFSMCPPSPCDVEFENANIVIDGKSSIRQKSKEATFRVQFNDTLTSTFEYPSEASLIIDDTYSNDALISAIESMQLNDTTDASPTRHHHVAVDEIIQLPTPANTSSPANNITNSATNTPTKNILGNLPLDYPILDKGIMSQQQEQQQQQQPSPQQVNLMENQNQKAASLAAPPLSEDSPQSALALEKTPILPPQHETACNALQQTVQSTLHDANTDKLDASAVATARLPPQPLVLPQRPTDLPLPMVLSTLQAQPKKNKLEQQLQKQQQQQQRTTQQKPQLPVKRQQHVTRTTSATAASKASPVSALPQFNLKAEIKPKEDIKPLAEVKTKVEAKGTQPETAISLELKREEKRPKPETSGNWQRERTADIDTDAKPVGKVEQPQALTTSVNQKSNASATHAVETPLAFDARRLAQPSLLRDFQLASVNTTEIVAKNDNFNTNNSNTTNNTAATGGATCNTNNNIAELTARTTNLTTAVTTTTAKKPISKYTMFHTLFEVTSADGATTTRPSNSNAGQRPRKTPAVLNKPQYARFLQIDRAAAGEQGVGILRTRSNEFQGRVSTAGGGGCMPKKQQAQATTNANQLLVQPSAIQQQRSASFSFGKHGRRNEYIAAAEKRCQSNTPASVVVVDNKSNTASAKIQNSKNREIFYSFNGISTDDECFEDAIDYFSPMPNSTTNTTTLANTSSYQNSNNASANNSISYKENQKNSFQCFTTNTKNKRNSVDSSEIASLPCTAQTRTFSTGTNNKPYSQYTSTPPPATPPTTLTTTTTTTLTGNICTTKTTTTRTSTHCLENTNNNKNKNTASPSSSNSSTNSSLTSSPTLSSSTSTTFYSYSSSLSAANCTRHHAVVNNNNRNIPYKSSNTMLSSAAKCLSPAPYVANKNVCNNNNQNPSTKFGANYKSTTTSSNTTLSAVGAQPSPFSLPAASTTLLRSRIPGNTLYYV
ncbi:mucin-17 [Ceratitis capitata]|uniref:mucin-17 n=1 Tax=Ceratitis capitata TaxID=7213 RepID=UPI0006188A31|nr:mucin-17 [Ceratitis capitata]